MVITQKDIVDLLLEYKIDVRASASMLSFDGQSFPIVCPFPDHFDRSPSFHVFRNEDASHHWYCFGCQRGTDAIEFVRHMEPRITWREVLEKAATDATSAMLSAAVNEIQPLSLQLFYMIGQTLGRISPADVEHRYEELDRAMISRRADLAWKTLEGSR